MFSCFTKCCAKKNSITNHPVRKVSDDTMKDFLSMVTNRPNYGIISKIRNDLERLEAFKKSTNDDCTKNISSV